MLSTFQDWVYLFWSFSSHFPYFPQYKWQYRKRQNTFHLLFSHPPSPHIFSQLGALFVQFNTPTRRHDRAHASRGESVSPLTSPWRLWNHIHFKLLLRVKLENFVKLSFFFLLGTLWQYENCVSYCKFIYVCIYMYIHLYIYICWLKSNKTSVRWQGHPREKTKEQKKSKEWHHLTAIVS